MKKSLFHIQQDYLQLAAILEDNGGEITPEIEETLAVNQEQLQVKGVNYAFIIRQLIGESDMIKAEMDRLSKLMKSKVASADRLKNVLKSAMELYGIESIKGDLINISLRNNAASVKIENEDALPKEFVTEKITKTPDKKALKEAIESGQEIKGVSLTRSRSILIK